MNTQLKALMNSLEEDNDNDNDEEEDESYNF